MLGARCIRRLRGHCSSDQSGGVWQTDRQVVLVDLQSGGGRDCLTVMQLM
jgi:hypothetical protein